MSDSKKLGEVAAIAPLPDNWLSKDTYFRVVDNSIELKFTQPHGEVDITQARVARHYKIHDLQDIVSVDLDMVGIFISLTWRTGATVLYSINSIRTPHYKLYKLMSDAVEFARFDYEQNSRKKVRNDG